MKELKPSEKAFWEEYINELPEEERPQIPFVESSFAGTRETTDKLIALYIEGKKTAGSSIAEGYKAAGEPLPKAGNYWIVLDSEERPRLILETLETAINKFKDVPLEIAQAEGEGDSSLAYWKKVHSKLWIPNLDIYGLDNLDEATVITEFFEIVYPLDKNEDEEEDEEKESEKKSDRTGKIKSVAKNMAMLAATAAVSVALGATAGVIICKNSTPTPVPTTAPATAGKPAAAPSPVVSTRPVPPPAGGPTPAPTLPTSSGVGTVPPRSTPPPTPPVEPASVPPTEPPLPSSDGTIP
ncbi:MAG: ASCH domain-containing protein [Patescibacteria group bacterium]